MYFTCISRVYMYIWTSTKITKHQLYGSRCPPILATVTFIELLKAVGPLGRVQNYVNPPGSGLLKVRDAIEGVGTLP